MKKTLIILLSMGAMPALADYTLDGASGYFYRDQEGNWTTHNTSGTLSTESGYDVSFTNGSGSTLSFKVGTRITFTVAITLDLSRLATPEANTKLFTVPSLGIGLDTDRRIATVDGNNVPWVSYGTTYTLSNSEELGNNGLVTVIFSTGDSGSTYSIQGQNNGSLDYWSWKDLKSGGAASTFTISDALAPALVNAVIWDTYTYHNPDSAAIYNVASTLSEAYLAEPDPTPAVPEPTTATLSLLALAGMAARRRRK